MIKRNICMPHAILPELKKQNSLLHKHVITMFNHNTKAGMHENPAMPSADITVKVELAI